VEKLLKKTWVQIVAFVAIPIAAAGCFAWFMVSYEPTVVNVRLTEVWIMEPMAVKGECAHSGEAVLKARLTYSIGGNVFSLDFCDEGEMMRYLRWLTVKYESVDGRCWNFVWFE